MLWGKSGQFLCARRLASTSVTNCWLVWSVKGKERPKSGLSHPVKNVHNPFPNFEGVFSGELDELWHGWGSSGPHVCKNRLSLICGCLPVGGASSKGL